MYDPQLEGLTTSRLTRPFPLGLQVAAAYYPAPGHGFRGYPLDGKVLALTGGALDVTGIGCRSLQPISADRRGPSEVGN